MEQEVTGELDLQIPFLLSPNGEPRATQAVPSLAKATSVAGSPAPLTRAVGNTQVHVDPLLGEHQTPDWIAEPRPRSAAKRMLFCPVARLTARAPIFGPPRVLSSGLVAWNVASGVQPAVGVVSAVMVHFKKPCPYTFPAHKLS